MIQLLQALDKQITTSPLILVISNRVDVRQVIQITLEHAPYRLYFATDVAGALEFISQESPVLVILDNALGAAVSRLIKSQLNAVVPLLLVVDSLHPSIIDRALDMGADDTIINPIHARTLERRVQQLLVGYEIAAQQQQAQSALHQSQQALSESEERFRALFEYSPDAIVLIDSVTNIIVDCNQVVCRMNGYSRDELLGQSIDLLNAYDQNGFNIQHYPHESYVELLRSKGLLKYETFHRHKDGTVFPVEVATALVTIRGRELILGIDRDITERKEVETTLREVQDRYRVMTQYTTDMISRHSLDGVLLYSSPSCETLLGYTPEELMGRIAYDFYHPTDRAQVLAHHLALKEEDEIFTDSYRIMCKDGTYIWFETISRKIRNPETGRFDEVICVSRDITDRKSKEAVERDQQLLVEALGDASAALKNSLKTNEALDRILEQAARVVPHDSSSISLIEGDQAYIVRCRGFKERGEEDFVMSLRFTISEENPFYKQLIRDKTPVIIKDVHDSTDWVDSGWIRSNLTAPVILHDQIIGLLHVDSAVPDAFTPDHAQHLLAFADQVAIALQSAQLYDDLQALYRATAFLFASFNADNIHELARQITQAVIKEFDKTDCRVGLVDYTNRRVVRVSHSGDFGVSKGLELDLDGTGLIPAAVQSGKVVYAPDVSKDERYLLSDTRIRSELVIPLRTRYEVIGVLDLQSETLDAFNQHDQRVLFAFAERAATAIENIQYAHDLERQVAQRTGELLRTNEQVEAILNNSSDAIIVTSVDGVIRRVNPAFNTLFGTQYQSEVELSFLELVASYDHNLLRESLREAAASRIACRVEVVLRRDDNTLFDADVAISPIQERDYQSMGLICSVRDITERKRMELELRKALEQERELSELKSRFVTTASHEFRTPLAMIMTSSELLSRYSSRMSEDQKTERLLRIQTEVMNMARLLDDVLTVNKSADAVATEFDPLPLDLVEFCREIVEVMRQTEQSSHLFTLSHSGNYTTVNLDQRFLRDILTNLLSNAIKYSSPNTEIFIELRCEQQQTIILVRDQGVGIAEEDQKRLFQAFHRGNNVGMVSGTGLGLTIAKQAAELHGGTITLTSTVGIGTTFVVTIPNVVIEDRNYDY
jgi:two-component system, OmpR family, sensor histidine kinase VicK